MLFITHDGRPALRCSICELPILAALDAVVVYARRIPSGELSPVTVAHLDFCRVSAQELLENELGPGLCMPLVEYGDRLREAHDSLPRAFDSVVR